MRFFFMIDGLVFRALRAFIGAVDRLVPFSEKHLARMLLGSYVVADVGRGLRGHSLGFSLFCIFLFLLVIVPQIDRLGTQRISGREDSPVQCVIRIVVLVLWTSFSVGDVFTRDSLSLVAHVSYPLLLYVLDMDPKEPGERRRVLDHIKEAVTRPGYSTAGAEA